MSGRIAKSQIPLRPRAQLPAEASVALISVKNELKKKALPAGKFDNRYGSGEGDGAPLPAPAQKCEYFEADVGTARDGDPLGRRGRKRLVVEINTASLQVMEVYYTEDHYRKLSFIRFV